jgi:dihydropyrimidinase
MSVCDTILRGGRVHLEDKTLVADIGITGGIITAIGDLSQATCKDEVDVSGLELVPGGIDSHAHIEQKTSTGLTPCDDFYTASISAMCGGTTTIIPFACQHRGMRVKDVVKDYRELAEKAAIDYAIHIIVSDPSAPHALEDLTELFEQGYTSVKVYMTYDSLKLTDTQLLDVFALCRKNGAMVMIHAESHELIAWITSKLLNAKLFEPKYHAVARHGLAEREATHRAITFAGAD